MVNNQLMDERQVFLNKWKGYRKKISKQNSLSFYGKYENILKPTSVFNRRNVSFQDNRKLPFYGWFPYKEGFSFQMVSKILKSSQLESGYVLDPFAGSGTTLFAAREKGFNSYGIELMPLGMVIYNARIAIEETDKNLILEWIKAIKKIAFSKAPIEQRFIFRHLKITERAFPPTNERCLNAFRTYINKEIKDSKIRTIFDFVGMCLLEKISYTSKDGQFLRWDKRAEKGRGSYLKARIYTFEEALGEFLSRMWNDLNNLSGFQLEKKPMINLQNGSVFDLLPRIIDNSYDMIISSPPYCNRYDYTRTYALELAYLGLDEEDIKDLRQKMLSSTVESKDKVRYLENLYQDKYGINELTKIEKIFYNNVTLSRILNKLDFYRKNKQLNNPGIYRMVWNYFYEHTFVIYEMYRVLKSGGEVYYVNDNVRYSGEEIPVDLILSEFAENVGFRIADIFVLPQKKGNSSQQMAKHGKTELRKCVYHWVKP